MQEIIVTIDPGAFTIGACTWLAKGFANGTPPFTAFAKDMSGTQRSIGALSAMKRHISLLEDTVFSLSTFKVKTLYCEKPQFFSSGRGFASKQHVLMLEMFRGMLYQVCHQNNVPFIDVGVLKWKGQLPKKLVNERIEKIFTSHNWDITVLSSNRSHDWDACGIGLYLQRLFQ